jgi:hypothetical protein
MVRKERGVVTSSTPSKVAASLKFPFHQIRRYRPMEALGRYMTSKTPPTSAGLGSIISVRELLGLIGVRIPVLILFPTCILTVRYRCEEGSLRRVYFIKIRSLN